MALTCPHDTMTWILIPFSLGIIATWGLCSQSKILNYIWFTSHLPKERAQYPSWVSLYMGDCCILLSHPLTCLNISIIQFPDEVYLFSLGNYSIWCFTYLHCMPLWHVFQITDACSACFEQRTVFTQQVLAKALNQMV